MPRLLPVLAVLLGCLVAALALTDDASILFVQGPQYKTDKIPETSFADLLAHTLGLEPLNAAQNRHNFPHLDFFDLPRSNVFVAVDAVGSEQATDFFPQAFKARVNRNNVVQDSIGYLVTLMTGATVAEHGVVGHSWAVDNQVVEAFSGPAAEPKAVAVADRLFEASSQSVDVCVSFDRQMAEALAAHRPSPSVVFYYSEAQQSFVNARNPNVVLLTKQQILEFGATLDNSDSLPFSVVAELAAIHTLPSFLAPLSRPSTPLFVGVSISSTRPLLASTPQRLPAVLALFQHELLSLNKALGDKNAMQIALLGSNVDLHTVDNPLPFNARIARSFVLRNDSSTTYTNTQINSFQIMLWTAVILAAAIIAASWTTCSMDTGTNTILHRLPVPRRSHDM